MGEGENAGEGSTPPSDPGQHDQKDNLEKEATPGSGDKSVAVSGEEQGEGEEKEKEQSKEKEEAQEIYHKGHIAKSPVPVDAESFPLTPDYIRDIAKYVGIEEKEVHLLWIARQAAEAKLPQFWKEFEDADGHPYFYNSVTDVSQRHHPFDQFFVNLVKQERAKKHKKQVHLTSNENPDHWMEFHIDNTPCYYNFNLNKWSEIKPGCFQPAKRVPLPGEEDDEGEDEGPKFAESVFSRNMQKNPDGYLHFTSWWNEGGAKRYLNIYHDIETAAFQIVLDDERDRLYNLVSIPNKQGEPLECWDLYVGARINILGKMTTLMQASNHTLEWLEKHAATFRKCKQRIEIELRKYDLKPMNPALTQDPGKKKRAASDMRMLLNQIEELKQRLAKYRPEFARALVDEFFTQKKRPGE